VTGLAPISARLGRVFYHPEAVVLAAEPFGALDPVLDDTRTAGSSQRRDESGSPPLRDDPSTAISTLIKTEPNRVLSVARAADGAAPSGGAAVGVLSVIFVGVPAVLGPVPVGVLELAVRDRL
jgi:hypothetical protein